MVVGQAKFFLLAAHQKANITYQKIASDWGGVVGLARSLGGDTLVWCCPWCGVVLFPPWAKCQLLMLALKANFSPPPFFLQFTLP